ncbi:hypothetical protein [Clostridium estertheticum]|uniref:hypothetical protein n=1 Tax=Clostridium estertheticum TaxID=238834 RepID=UPI001C0CD65B|nr:hypothetical protein [Clostridium estertheticum]MBU3173268.1 hypothetical protein [Clostridium estertheticum]
MAKNTQKIVYTTSLDSELAKKFKVYCALKGKYQNEVLEELINELLEKEGDGVGNNG